MHEDNGLQIDDLVGKVVEEYCDRSSRDERPQLDEFFDRSPEISELLKTVIPALQVTEETFDLSASDIGSGKHQKQLGIFASCVKSAVEGWVSLAKTSSGDPIAIPDPSSLRICSPGSRAETHHAEPHGDRALRTRRAAGLRGEGVPTMQATGHRLAE